MTEDRLESRVPCERTLTPSETVLQVITYVSPNYSNPLGILHGGYMLSWLVDAATINSTRIARSYTLLACIEDMLFISPVRVGDTVIITSWIEYIGTSSLELSVMVETENPVRGGRERRLTTYSSLTMVSVDENLKPKPIGACIEPRSKVERELYQAALERREARKSRIEKRKELVNDITPLRTLSNEYTVKSYLFVNPEDTVGYDVLHAGKLLKTLDEIAGIVASRYAESITVTGAVDATDFYSPITVGDVVEITAGLTYVGTKSLEIAAKILVRNPFTWHAKHSATSYFTFVAIDASGRSKPAKSFEPLEEWQLEVLNKGAKRKERREKLLAGLRSEDFNIWLESIRSGLKNRFSQY